jgi:hypothetical protein
MLVRAGGRAQVVAGSRAETCGMRIGDVIVSVNGSAAASPKQVSCDMMMELITENASRASVGSAQLYRNLEQERPKLGFGFRVEVAQHVQMYTRHHFPDTRLATLPCHASLSLHRPSIRVSAVRPPFPPPILLPSSFLPLLFQVLCGSSEYTRACGELCQASQRTA